MWKTRLPNHVVMKHHNLEHLHRLGKNRYVTSGKKLSYSRRLCGKCRPRENSSFNLIIRHRFRVYRFKRHLYCHYCKFLVTFITRDGFDCSIWKGQPIRSRKRAEPAQMQKMLCAASSSQQVSWHHHDICVYPRKIRGHKVLWSYTSVLT